MIIGTDNWSKWITATIILINIAIMITLQLFADSQKTFQGSLLGLEQVFLSPFL